MRAVVGFTIALLLTALLLTGSATGCGAASAAEANPKIAFASKRDGNPEIYVINADGSGLRRLTRNSGVDALPTWSPDGRRIAFVRVRGENLEIYVMNADGSGQRNLTRNPAVDVEPTWSPDGKKIAFARGSSRKQCYVWQIFVMNADGSGQPRLTAGDGCGLDTDPKWSPDGKRITFIRALGENHVHLFVMNADGSGQRMAASERASEVLSRPDFSWSPDGKRIAVASYGSGIYVVNADGRGERNLTQTGDEDNWGPTWSPDGTRIAFWRGNDGGSDWDPGQPPDAVITVMNADGSGVRKLTTKGSASILPAWSPDGKRIAFVRGSLPKDAPGAWYNSKRTLWLMNADGSGQRKLATQVDPEGPPAWQPAP